MDGAHLHTRTNREYRKREQKKPAQQPALEGRRATHLTARSSPKCMGGASSCAAENKNPRLLNGGLEILHRTIDNLIPCEG